MYVRLAFSVAPHVEADISRGRGARCRRRRVPETLPCAQPGHGARTERESPPRSSPLKSSTPPAWPFCRPCPCSTGSRCDLLLDTITRLTKWKPHNAQKNPRPLSLRIRPLSRYNKVRFASSDPIETCANSKQRRGGFFDIARRLY